MKSISLNWRAAQDDQYSDEIPIYLFEITHDDLDKPIRVSTDNTERLSTDPLYYGTRSTWRGADPDTEPFLFVVAEAKIPDDTDGGTTETQLVLLALDAEYMEILRSFTTPAVIHLGVFLASDPNTPEAEFFDQELAVSEWSEGQIALTLSRDDIDLEHFPAGRMIRTFFPGLHL